MVRRRKTIEAGSVGIIIGATLLSLALFGLLAVGLTGGDKPAEIQPVFLRYLFRATLPLFGLGLALVFLGLLLWARRRLD